MIDKSHPVILTPMMMNKFIEDDWKTSSNCRCYSLVALSGVACHKLCWRWKDDDKGADDKGDDDKRDNDKVDDDKDDDDDKGDDEKYDLLHVPFLLSGGAKRAPHSSTLSITFTS